MDFTKRGIPKQKTLYYGADYNPDQWQHDPSVFERDIDLMKQAGVTSASVGIFSWTALEPEEGQYTFAWLDRVMDRFAEEGMFVFLATPSGSKPMWMSERYPEVRRVGVDGIRESSGARHNHCMSSPIYREKTRAINTALATRYKDHPALALWHVGNEYSGECHCELCRANFQDWLKEKYKTLDALNEAWWSRFWNHTFTDWSQIPTFDESIDGLMLDWRRFSNDQHVSFFLNEMEPLREITPDVPCTTNFMGTHEGTNYWQWAEHLDIISNDLYPMPDDRAQTWRHAIRSDFIHSMMRGMSGGKPWMLLECSPSSVNWGGINKLKRPGVHRQEILQAVANGADTIHYFQWRKGRGGYEKFHGAVVDHEGSDKTRVFQECAEIGEELKMLQRLLGKDCLRAQIGLIYDWESRWALNLSGGPKPIAGQGPFPSDLATETAFDHYEAWTRAGFAIDVLSVKSDWSQYAVLVLPALYMVSQDTADRLRDYVASGGVLIGTYLTGYVDTANRCWLGGFPGAGLREVFGVWNEELDNLHDETRVNVKASENSEFVLEAQACDVVEVVHEEGAQVLVESASEFYAGSAIVSRNSLGDGIAYYIAARLDTAVLKALYIKLSDDLGLVPESGGPLPDGVVSRKRESASGEVRFLFNYTREPQPLDPNVGKALAPYETRIFR